MVMSSSPLLCCLIADEMEATINDFSGGEPGKVAYLVTDDAANMRLGRRTLVQRDGFK